jgi:hypothetical protein
MEPQGFKHEDDWQRHPYGCDCNKCANAFELKKLGLIELLEKMNEVKP